MKTFFSVILSKIIYFICKLFRKNGYQLPGYFVYDVFKDHNVLNRLKYPKYIVAVTGSSGKGTTCSLIKNTLERNNYKVLYNESGNNGILGIISFILLNTKLNGTVKGDALILECDEKHLKLIFNKMKPSHLIITNITRDQPSRNGNPMIIYNEIEKIIDNKMNLIINADDPLISRLKLKYNNITTYGINEFKDDYKENPINNVDFAYCPVCHTKLKYNYYHYGHLGNYECPNKDFSRGKVMYEASNINLNDLKMDINNNTININKGAIYVCYAYLATYSLLSSIGIKDEDIVNSFNDHKIETKRGKELYFNDRLVTMLETKNENNLSYYQSIKYIVNQKETKTIILGFENVSRRYKFNDLSWLYDVDFEEFKDDKNIDKIVCIGRFKYDVATRLEYAGIDKNKIILVDDLDNLVNIVKKDTKGNIYTMVCFDMTAIIRKMIYEKD